MRHIEPDPASRPSTEVDPVAKTDQAYPVQTHSDGPYILLVDDDPDAQAIMSVILQILGWEAKTVSSGAEALEAVAARPPALVLLDLMMPGMSGFEVLSRLKADPRSRNIPVVIISALGGDQRLVRLGASGVIQKGDVNKEMVRQMVDDCLSGQR